MELTPSVTAPSPRADLPPARRAFRADIQALRALAIGAVVLNHLWPTRFAGGYVGVDVFFVISGFLITGHLFGELEATGRVALGRFYARRIRRLLPAALLVLAIVAGLVALFLPFARWARNGAEILASATYVENWALSAMAVEYSAMNDAASAVQHFWSLSVEEQFYLVWPLLMLAAVAVIARRRLLLSPRAAVIAALSIIAAASFASSIVATAAQPAQAYFATYTRAWEFAVGGLIAMTVAGRRAPRRAADLLVAAGAATIVAVVFLYDQHTPFPGFAAALPALGTAAVIAAGTLSVRTCLSPLFGLGPVQWVGDVSYSLYLWHWPLIVVAPFALASELSGPLRVSLLAGAVLLAGLTRRWVEIPAQRARPWASSSRRAMLGMVAGMAIVGLLAGLLLIGAAVRSGEDLPTATLPEGPCAGPSAMIAANACADRFGPAESVQSRPRNEYFYTPPECSGFLATMTYGDKSTTRVCDYSGGKPGAPTVWLVGDSHAQQWQGPVFAIARDRGWRLTLSYLGGCPPADVAFNGYRALGAPADVDRCRMWSRDVSDAIVAARPNLVITSMAARREMVDDGSGRPATAQFVEGLQRDWARWTAAGPRVLVIADPPFNGEVRNPDCVALNPRNPLSCARPREIAQPPDPLVIAAATMGDTAVTLFDATPFFCDDAECYSVIGGVVVYYDPDHLNLEYARMLRPMLEAALPESMRDTSAAP